MILLRYINKSITMDVKLIIPILGIITGIIIPIAVFIWLYYDAKNQREAVVEIAKTLK